MRLASQAWHYLPCFCVPAPTTLSIPFHSAPTPSIPPQGLLWRDRDLYESEIKPLQRLLVDCPLSGGAWLHVPPGAGSLPGGGWSPVPEGQRVSSCAVEAVAHWQAVCCLSPDASQMANPGWDPLAPISRGLGADRETAAAAAVHPSSEQGCASQQAQQAAAANLAVRAAAEAARRGDIAPLRMAVMDVCTATADGVDRSVCMAARLQLFGLQRCATR